MYSLTNMSTGQFFAPLFCEFRCATFFHKSSPQKIARLHGRYELLPMRNILVGIVLTLSPMWAVACGEENEFPHEFQRSKGIIFNTNECVPLRILVPTRYKDHVITRVLLTVGSSIVKANSLEVDMVHAKTVDIDNKSEIHLCVNHEVAPNMRLELQYVYEQKSGSGFVYSCGPTIYVIDNFMLHLEHS